LNSFIAFFDSLLVSETINIDASGQVIVRHRAWMRIHVDFIELRLATSRNRFVSLCESSHVNASRWV
jgi:hypothetical protein